MIEGGYFLKRVARRPACVNAAGVKEVCSVSDCISSSPDGWLQRWRHNGFGWFNSIADAMSVVPTAERSLYRLFAYRVDPFVYRQGLRADFVVPSDVHPDPIGPAFIERGFDAANKSLESVLGLECSPLSCNDLAAEMSANAFCLFPTHEAALTGAQAFSL